MGGRAILRRFSRGVFGAQLGDTLYDWKHVEYLRGDPDAARSGSGYQLRIKRLPPGEIARLSEAIPYLHAAELLTLLPDRIAAEVLEVMGPKRQLQVFEELNEEDERLTAELKNTRAYNLFGGGTFAMVTSAVTMMLGTQLLKLLGVKLF